MSEMTDDTFRRLDAVEAALRSACRRARAQGALLIRGAFEADLSQRKEAIAGVGVCAWGALGFVGDDVAVELTPDEYDATEMGWDGEIDAALDRRMSMLWYFMGARLAQEFKPVAVGELEEQ